MTLDTSSPDREQPETLPVLFRAVVDDPATERLRSLFDAAWPAYRRWYLRDGIERRSSYAECRRALRTHVPELVPTYERLVEMSGGSDLEARFLSLWDPPPFFAACSMAAWTGADGPALIRNYDYVPALCETTALASSFTGRTVVAMADCLWGALDGVNDAGLAIALSFGGRRAVGRGFSIALVVRYLLEVCDDVAGAIKVVERLPVNLSYNLLLVDRSGDAAVVYLAPDRPPSVSRNGRYAANRQGETEWPDHAEMSETIARESALAEAIDDAAMTRAELERRFLAAPVHRSLELHAWGTVYTASYDTQEPALRLLWPGEEWALPLTEPQESERTLEMPVTFPPLVAREVDVPRSASMIVF